MLNQAADQHSRCPVPQSARARAVYDVYGRRIDLPAAGSGADPLAALRASDVLDPKNNMPLAPNQHPFPGQRRLLSTDRMDSTIPKGGTDSTWLYPSPQMFFNGAALRARSSHGPSSSRARGSPTCVATQRRSQHALRRRGRETQPAAHPTSAAPPVRCLAPAALKRKGKGGDVTEEVMDSVVRARSA